MILVTGSSGFIGRRLVAAVAATGEPVRAVARHPAPAADGVLPVAVDVRDRGSMRAAAEGCRLVYHLAGSYRSPPAETREVHAGGTANLLDAAADGTRVVLVSSTSVYGWEGPWPVDETVPAHPVGAYGEAKLAAEQLALAWTGGEAVVARPTIVYGPGDRTGMLARAARLLHRGWRWFPGDGRAHLDLLHVDDLVAALVALGHGGSGVYVLGGHSVAVGEALAMLADGAGLPAPAFGVPGAAGVATVLEGLWRAAGVRREPPLTRHAVEVLTRDRSYSSARARRDLDWEPVTAPAEGVPATGRWLAAEVLAPRPARGRAGTAADTAGDGGGERELGFDWRGYFEDPDEGLGTVYERFALDGVIVEAMARTGSDSVLHAPAFGMMGIPGLDAVLRARAGTPVGLVDFDPERLDAVVGLWKGLGLSPGVHAVDGPDPSRWPASLPEPYDLVFSFAALWWFADPGAVLAAQARWARRGLLVCVPNRNVFLAARARLWHRGLFARLNLDALDAGVLAEAIAAAGWHVVADGLFDIPPFPDTSVPLGRLLRRDGAAGDGAWRWSILPFLEGRAPDLPERMARLARIERRVPAPVAPAWAHHRYLLAVPSGAVTQTM